MGCCPDAGCRLRSQEWLPEWPALLERPVLRRLAQPRPEQQVPLEPERPEPQP
jgi:hypothetical protein